MKELLIRSLFGIVFLAIVFVPFAIDLTYHVNTFNFVLLLFALIGTFELYAMRKALHHSSKMLPVSLLIVILAFLPFILTSLHDFMPSIDAGISVNNFTPEIRFWLLSFWAIFLVALILFIVLIFRKNEIAFIVKGSFILGLVYPLLPLLLLSFGLTVSDPSEKRYLFIALIPIYLNDTLAYASGRFFGKNKLFPSVSPKKTWEGFFGGVIGTLIVMHVIVFFAGEYSINNAFIITFVSILASVLATFGDLFESKLKRAAGVKDSGKILPGHGGILDRIDAMLFVAPVLYVLLAHIL
ncbi:MAG: phosphatidate cytidylyltransferase [Fluviicola sp.]|nr:phosphatidate cytidylyltransferase [Fluviicola sp.]